jgi:four helix bundle protein
MARFYWELQTWQLADEIRQHVFRWTKRPRFAADLKARAQIDDAINSTCRNIAEGFAGSHAEFARYLGIARRSLNEVRDCARGAELKGYITTAEANELNALARRLQQAAAELIAYLRHTPDPPQVGRRNRGT